METLTKVTLKTTTLQDLVSRAVKACTFIDVLPLTCLMHMIIKDKKLTITTTNNVDYLTTYADVDTSDFEMIVDAKIFSDLVSKLNTPEVSLSLDGNRIIIESNGTYYVELRTDVQGQKLTIQAPEVECIGASFHITTQELKSILGLNHASKAEDKDIPPLYNYYANADRVLTTDSEKATMNPIKITDTPISISPNVMNLTMSVANEDGIDVYQDSDFVVFESSVGRLVGKKMAQSDVDNFPVEDLNEVFNLSSEHFVKINRTMLISAIDRICLFTKAYEGDNLTLVFKKDSVTLWSMSTKSNESVNYMNELPIDNEVTLTVQSKALRDQLSACDQETLSMSFLEGVGVITECGDAKLLVGVVG